MTNPQQQTDVTVSEALSGRKAAAEARLKAALDSVDEAQRLLEQAAQALCSVSGMVAEWRRVGKLYDQVRRTWYALAGKGGRLRRSGGLLLDHKPNSHESQWGRSSR